MHWWHEFQTKTVLDEQFVLKFLPRAAERLTPKNSKHGVGGLDFTAHDKHMSFL